MSVNSGHRYIAFGNNLCGNLDPACSSVIRAPTDVSDKFKTSKVCWTSWTCTIGTDPLTICNNDTSLSIKANVKRIIGNDEPVAFLLETGQIQSSNAAESSEKWDDVVMTGLGTVYACKNCDVFRYESLDDLMVNRDAFGPIQGLPVSDQESHLSKRLKLFATESRGFVHVSGLAEMLYEIIDVRSLPPHLVKSTNPVQLEYIPDLEAVGALKISTGSGNRLGIITEVGSAYILPFKGDIEEISFDEQDIRLMGLGVDFEVIVTNKDIFVRGSSEYCLAID